MPNVIPFIVTKLRSGRTAVELFKHLPKDRRLNARTLDRIEGSGQEFYQCNQKTLENLARALGVAPGVLEGALDLPEEIETAERILKPIEHFETRLVKLDDKFVIVEFSKDHETGRTIARDIEDEEAGKRLSRAAEWKKKLIEVYRMISHPDGFLEGFLNHMLNEEPIGGWGDEDDFKAALDGYINDLGQTLGVERSKGQEKFSLRSQNEEASQ